MTLRARMTFTLVALVLVGLVALDLAMYAALRSFLVRRVDHELRSAARPVAELLLSPTLSSGEVREDSEATAFLPAGTWATLYGATGAVARQITFTYGRASGSPPVVDPAVAGPAGADPTLVTVEAPGGGGAAYRAIAIRLEGGAVVVLAAPLDAVAQTLHRLTWVAGLVTLGVLIAMAAVSWLTVRRELRPLRRIEATAGAIAAGDLSRRVEPTDPRTEVGRLGEALNVMLGRIERSMQEQRASEEALRRFLADASHELRTPLTSIRGYAELFRRGAEDDPQDTALAMRRIEQESERMAVLVDDLLFLARSGQGRPLDRARVDLAAVAADAVQDARAVDPDRAVTLDASGETAVIGDEGRLRQVLANLLSNALSHTPPGTPVEVRVRAEDGWARLDVRDRGLGLGADDAAHVFEPFFRADPARARPGSDRPNGAGPGAGLGLSIVDAVAQAHGGSAQLTSAPGEGAVFTVRLPLAPGGARSPERAATTPRGA